MNFRAVIRLIGAILFVLSLSMFSCLIFAYRYEDPHYAIESIFYSGGILFVTGALLWFLTRGPKLEFKRRDGFGIVTFGWIAAANFGALPYVLSGVIPDIPSAVFETMSGFTTTGASVLTDLENIPKGIMFWRCLTQWFGGMGVLVLCVAILPFLGVGGMQIYRAEIPGPSKDRLTPRIASTAKLLWGVYVGLSVMETGLLKLAGMSWYDALCHTFTTMSTGGFSTRTASVAAFDSGWIEFIIIVFMFLAGVNFALHFRALRGQVGSYFRDPEFRFYLLLFVGVSVFLGFNTWGRQFDSIFAALRSGFFQAGSIITTTGFATEDFDQWPAASRLLLVLCMFLGGSAGSTSGGMKIVRFFIVAKASLREIRLFMHPKAVFSIKLGQKPVEHQAVSNILAFFIIFILIFAVTTILMTPFTPDLTTAATAVVATLGNIGPGLGAVGPAQNFSIIPDAGKIILTFCMLLGRLELYTVLVLLLPSFWKR